MSILPEKKYGQVFSKYDDSGLDLVYCNKLIICELPSVPSFVQESTPSSRNVPL